MNKHVNMKNVGFMTEKWNLYEQEKPSMNGSRPEGYPPAPVGVPVSALTVDQEITRLISNFNDLQKQQLLEIIQQFVDDADAEKRPAAVPAAAAPAAVV